MWVLHNRPNGCKTEENDTGDFEPRGTVFETIVFFRNEPIGSFSPVQGEYVDALFPFFNLCYPTELAMVSYLGFLSYELHCYYHCH